MCKCQNDRTSDSRQFRAGITMAVIKKLHPSVEELLPTEEIKCPECSNRFKSTSHLNLHLAKTHKNPALLTPDDCIKNYHCPETSCKYHLTSFFKSLKLLKQHYKKVHLSRTFHCQSCIKAFPTLLTQQRHSEYCNSTFKCCDCECFYFEYEVLLTHARRKNHRVLKKEDYKVQTDRPSKIVIVQNVQISNVQEQYCQTEAVKVNRGTQVEIRPNQDSVGTQTNGNKLEKLVSFGLNSELVNNLKKNSASTQTRHDSDSQSFDESVFSNMETQTLEDDLFKCDYYSHMHTQTCEDLLFSDIGFSDIQTQTADELRSVESQTICDLIEFKDTTHMETQTDLDFDQLFESVQ